MITPGHGTRHWSEDDHPWDTEYSTGQKMITPGYGARDWSEDDLPWIRSTTLVRR